MDDGWEYNVEPTAFCPILGLHDSGAEVIWMPACVADDLDGVFSVDFWLESSGECGGIVVPCFLALGCGVSFLTTFDGVVYR